MYTRRKFLAQTAGSIAAASAYVPCPAGAPSAVGPSINLHKGPRIKSVIRRDDTILRLGGHGDNNRMTWSTNDRQLLAVCDGYGWIQNPTHMYNSRLFAVTGMPGQARFEDVAGYPDLESGPDAKRTNRYYGLGTIALGNRIYQFLSTLNHNAQEQPDCQWIGAKLIYSPDSGRTWRNQDGSNPVGWESWEHRSKENMVFFQESSNAFSLLSVVQMGKGYTANMDGFVYVYAPNGNTDVARTQLVLLRVPKDRILDRRAYEYFSGWRRPGRAAWTKDIDARGVVHTFPLGWVNDPTTHLGESAWGWVPSITYNEPLGLYVMTNWGTGCTPDRQWFGKPSYLGFWVANKPWGPWTQIHEESAWTPNHDSEARCYMPQIPPKWIAEDGRSFWLVWSDFQIRETEELKQKEGIVDRMTPPEQKKYLQALQPYYSFNTQRVDLFVA
jgi:Domain of unknown function (DUF4185)